jgi:hypothetical protein
MSSRIGSLHLRYRSPGGGSLAAAMAPHLDRLLAARLGDAIDERLTTRLGDDAEVIVIRELTARVAMGRADWSLDSRFVDKIGRASVDAIVSTLGRPASSDSIVRFADQAEFVGSFILDLLAGLAWERWYFGAFTRYRRGDTAETIGAVLQGNHAHAVAIFGWLARRGHLDTVIALLGSERAKSFTDPGITTDDRSSSTRELAPLMAAALQLLTALGWSVDEDTYARIASDYFKTDPLPPTWTDRRSLSAWLLRFLQLAADTLTERGSPRAGVESAAARALLAGPLDWLDASWIAPQLDLLASDTSGSPGIRSARRVLTSDHELALDRLAEIVRRRRIRLDARHDRHALSIHLLAVLSEGKANNDGHHDRAIAAVIGRIAHAFCVAAESGLDGQRISQALERGPRSPGALPGGLGALADRLEDVRAAGPAAMNVLQQLVKAIGVVDAPGDATSAGGLFLLTRSLLDVKLHALARTSDVPFEPLKGALAAWWLDQTPPFDAGAAIWIGDDRPQLSALEASRKQLEDLQDSLFDLLRNQHAIDALPSDDVLDIELPPVFTALEWSEETHRTIARIGWMVLQAWSRWLPGLRGSSRRFLVGNCLRRAAAVRVSSTDITVCLDPAPLDVVVEMAGYFRPIVRVPWLKDRTITFTVRRAARN